MYLINTADYYIKNSGSDFHFDLIYPFTTENINGYIDEFDLKDKSLLTVGSSGDQAINAAYKGCSNITIFDICTFSEMYYYLKVATLLTLSRNRFCEFFSTHNRKGVNSNVFNINTFNSIKNTLKSLNYTASCFWETMFSKYTPEQIRFCLFGSDEDRIESIIKYNPYLTDSDSYEETKRRVQNTDVSFIRGDVTVDPKLNDKFDNIWLSNIAAWITDNETKTMLENFIPYLNDDGKILLAYIYNSNPNSYVIGDLLKLLKDYDIDDSVSFNSSTNIKSDTNMIKDGILTYKKSTL